MCKKNEEIKKLLMETTIPITTIAKQMGVTAATVHNINKGRSHYDDNLFYPLRRSVYHNHTEDNKLAFLYEYKSMYKPAVMAAILNISYETTCRYYSEEAPHQPYSFDSCLENRKGVVDIMAEPRPELIHNYGDSNITWEDATYIKFLYSIGKDEIPIIWCYKKWLDEEFFAQKHPIMEDYESLARYIEWGGTKSKLIWFIRGIGNGKVKGVMTAGNQFKTFKGSDFDMRRLRRYMTPSDFEIATEIAAKIL